MTSPQPGNQDERVCRWRDKPCAAVNALCLRDCQRTAAASGQTGAGEEADETRPETAGKNRSDDAGRVGRLSAKVAPVAGPPAPSAGQDTGQVRDEIARVLRRDYESEHATDEPVSAWHPVADEILATPTVRRLIAERDDLRRELDQARGQVQAIRDLHSPSDRGTGPQCQGCATHVTFAAWPCATIRALGPT